MPPQNVNRDAEGNPSSADTLSVLEKLQVLTYATAQIDVAVAALDEAAKQIGSFSTFGTGKKKAKKTDEGRFSSQDAEQAASSSAAVDGRPTEYSRVATGDPSNATQAVGHTATSHEARAEASQDTKTLQLTNSERRAFYDALIEGSTASSPTFSDCNTFLNAWEPSYRRDSYDLLARQNFTMPPKTKKETLYVIRAILSVRKDGVDPKALLLQLYQNRFEVVMGYGDLVPGETMKAVLHKGMMHHLATKVEDFREALGLGGLEEAEQKDVLRRLLQSHGMGPTQEEQDLVEELRREGKVKG